MKIVIHANPDVRGSGAHRICDNENRLEAISSTCYSSIDSEDVFTSYVCCGSSTSSSCSCSCSLMSFWISNVSCVSFHYVSFLYLSFSY